MIYLSSYKHFHFILTVIVKLYLNYENCCLKIGQTMQRHLSIFYIPLQSVISICFWKSFGPFALFYFVCSLCCIYCSALLPYFSPHEDNIFFGLKYKECIKNVDNLRERQTDGWT